MKKKIQKLLLTVPLATLIASCGSGSGTKSTPPPPANPPQGLISYEYVSALHQHPNVFITPGTTNQLNGKQLNYSILGCQSAIQDANWGLTFLRNFVGFIPEVGSILGVAIGTTTTALSIAGTAKGNSCQSASANIMNQQLQQQQQQINQIESTLGLLENSFYTQNVQTELQNTQSAIYGYNQVILGLDGNTNTGVDGYFQNFMVNSGFWSYDYVVQPQIDAESIAANPSNLANLKTIISSSQSFTNWVNSLSGSQYNQNTCANAQPLNSPNNAYQCYQYVESSPIDTSSILAVYSSLYNSLGSEVTAAISNNANLPVAQQTNIVDLFDQYNQVVVAYYLKSAYALQQAYFMEQAINQINLYESQGGSPQLPSLGQVPGTWFSYNNYSTGESQGYYVAQYNQAQEQLALMYAARYNQLYINALSYIVSDKPKGNQTLPPLVFSYTIDGVESSVDLSSVYTKISSQVQTPIDMLFSGPNAINQSVVNGLILYQFGGLSNAGACMSSLSSYNQSTNGQGVLSQALNSQNCPAIFADSNGNAYNGSYYDGDTIKPYYAANSNVKPYLAEIVWHAMATPVINGIPVANSIAACQSNQNLYWYYPDGSSPTLAPILNQPYLSCNLWKTSTDLILQNYNPNWTNANTTWPSGFNGLNWGYSILMNFPVPITPIAADSWTNFNTPTFGQWCYKNAPTNCYTTASMSGASAQSIGLTQLMLGNMETNYQLGSPYSVHQMAFQTTASDGFVGSFVLQFFNQDGSNGNGVGITCNKMLNNVGFMVPLNEPNGGALIPIQTPCDQATNNQDVAMVNLFGFAPVPYFQMGGGTDPSVEYAIFNITTMSGDKPNAINGAVLATNDSIVAQGTSTVYSPSGLAFLAMQTDGNLVLYGYSKANTQYQAIWATGTNAVSGTSSDNLFIVQDDGNLVIYPNGQVISGTAIWATGTSGSNLYLSVQDDGNMVLYNQQDQAVWATNTSLPQ